MVARSRLQHILAVAIGALDEVFVAHLEVDLGMAERAAAPVAGDAGIVHFDDFGRFDGHGKVLILRRDGIIAGSVRAATGCYLFGSKRPMVRFYTATPRVRTAPSPFHSFISPLCRPVSKPWSPNAHASSA